MHFEAEQSQFNVSIFKNIGLVLLAFLSSIVRAALGIPPFGATPRETFCIISSAALVFLNWNAIISFLHLACCDMCRRHSYMQYCAELINPTGAVDATFPRLRTDVGLTMMNWMQLRKTLHVLGKRMLNRIEDNCKVAVVCIAVLIGFLFYNLLTATSFRSLELCHAISISIFAMMLTLATLVPAIYFGALANDNNEETQMLLHHLVMRHESLALKEAIGFSESADNGGVVSTPGTQMTLLLERMVSSLKLEDALTPIEFLYRRADMSAIVALLTVVCVFMSWAVEIIFRRSPALRGAWEQKASMGNGTLS